MLGRSVWSSRGTEGGTRFADTSATCASRKNRSAAPAVSNLRTGSASTARSRNAESRGYRSRSPSCQASPTSSRRIPSNTNGRRSVSARNKLAARAKTSSAGIAGLFARRLGDAYGAVPAATATVPTGQAKSKSINVTVSPSTIIFDGLRSPWTQF